MRVEETTPDALAGLAPEAAARLQFGAAWLDFTAPALAAICGEGARLSVLAAFDRAGLAAAAPLVRTSPGQGTRPFPWDPEDLFFGLWIRAAAGGDDGLRGRALASQAFGAVLGAANPSLRRALVLHPPLSPASGAWLAPRLDAANARAAVRELLAAARQIAASEDRCAVVPRVRRGAARDGAAGDGAAWEGAFEGWVRARSYSNAELSPSAPPERRVRQMIARNRRLMERHGVTVTEARTAPPGVPFGALFAATAGRHRDPAPRLDDGFFRDLGARFAGRIRYLIASTGGRAAGFLTVIERGASWEAFKCGADRALAAGAPVYLDLLYGRLRESAARERVATVELGPGDLHVKRHYGAATVPMDCLLALPPRFRGARLFRAYVRAVGEGIAAREVAQVESVATTPK